MTIDRLPGTFSAAVNPRPTSGLNTENLEELGRD